MTLIFLPALTPWSYNTVGGTTLKQWTVEDYPSSTVDGISQKSSSQLLGSNPISTRYGVCHRQIVPYDNLWFENYFVLIIEERFTISLSLPFWHALESEGKVSRFENHMPGKAQNFASTVLSRPLRTLSPRGFQSAIKGHYCSSSPSPCSLLGGRQIETTWKIRSLE